MNEKRTFTRTAKILLAFGLLFLFLGGMVTALEASRIDFVPYSSYSKAESPQKALPIEERVVDIPISEGWATLAIDLPSPPTFEVKDDLGQRIRVSYQVPVDESGDAWAYGLDSVTHYQENEEWTEPTITTLYRHSLSPEPGMRMDFWFQELRQGKLVYDDGSGSYLDPGMESQIQIEVSQEVMDQLQMDADYPRFHFQ